MKTFVITPLLGLFVLVPSGPPDTKKPETKKIETREDSDIPGIYAVHGEGKERYHGACVIRRFESVFLVQWIIGGTHTLGIGLRQGDVLSIGWTQEAGGAVIRGVTVYTIRGRSLEGRWTSLPKVAVIRERLEFLKALPPDD